MSKSCGFTLYGLYKNAFAMKHCVKLKHAELFTAKRAGVNCNDCLSKYAVAVALTSAVGIAQAAVPQVDLDVVNEASSPASGGFTELSFTTGSTVNDGQNEADHGAGNGETVIYPNVGTVEGRSIDFKAEVLSASVNADDGSYDNPTFNINPGDNANVSLSNSLTGSDNEGIIGVRWSAVWSDTGEAAIGNFTMLVNDLDIGGKDITRFERVSVTADTLDAYVLENPTDITVFNSGDFIVFSPLDSDPGAPGVLPDNSVQLTFTNTSEFIIEYHRRAAGANMGLDGNFSTPFFSNPNINDTNPDFSASFTEADPPVNLAAASAERCSFHTGAVCQFTGGVVSTHR